MKTIICGEGLARLKVPSHWEEIPQENGSITFFDNKDKRGGELDFIIDTVRAPSYLPKATVNDCLKEIGIKRYREMVSIDAKNIMVTQEERGMEYGVRYLTFYVYCIHQNNDGHFNVALFTWNIEDEFDDMVHGQKLTLIEKMARSMIFTS